MLIHKMSVVEEFDAPLIAAEAYLMDTCKEYNIDYVTCECGSLPVTEGIISGFVNIVKTIFQKAIQLLVKLWKAVVGIVKAVIKKAVEFFKRLLGIKTQTKVDIKVPIISKPGKAEIKEVKSGNDSVSIFKQAFGAISQEINNLERINIGLMKRFESNTTNHVKEHYMPTSFAYNTDVEEGVAIGKATKGEFDKRSEKTKAGAEFRKIEQGAIDDMIHNYEELGVPTEVVAKIKKAYTNITFQGDSRISHAQIGNINAIDMKKAQALVESQNICAMYEELKDASLQNVFNRVKEIASNPKWFEETMGLQIGVMGLSGVAELCNQIMQNNGCTEHDVEQYLKGSWFPDFENITDNAKKEAAINKWVHLRINWNKGIIRILELMIRNNQKLLGLTTEEVEILSNELKEGKLDGVRDKLEANKDKIISKDHKLIDGRKLGLGCICISDAIAKDSLDEDSADHMHKGWYYEVANFWSSDTAVTYMTKYDVTIVGHGESDTSEDEKGEWVVEKIATPSGHYCKPREFMGQDFILMNDLVDQLIKEGFKRINIVSCNPGAHHLPKHVVDNKRVLVRMNLTSTLISG